MNILMTRVDWGMSLLFIGGGSVLGFILIWALIGDHTPKKRGVPKMENRPPSPNDPSWPSVDTSTGIRQSKGL